MQTNHWIGRCAQQALLYEVSATPKPGLVDRDGPGIHTDMDFYTFLASAAALGPYFHACAEMGRAGGTEIEALLPALKPLGIEAEKVMYSATGGVNTHKGLIYALGLLCTATGRAVSQEMHLQGDFVEKLCGMVNQMVKPHMPDEISHLGVLETYGAKQYRQYGLLGARGEALSGYAHARVVGLSAIKEGLSEMALSVNDALLYALLQLIPIIEDSNVIGRKGLDVLRESQRHAKNVIEVGHFCSDEGRSAYSEYLTWSLKTGVSHGGAADMLSVSIFLWLIGQVASKKV